MRTSTLACALALLLAAPAAAQTSDWSFALSPYLWLPGVSTSTETGRGSVDVDTSASDAIAALDFAFMGAAEARNGRWSLILDLVYSDLSSEADTPLGQLWRNAKVDTRLTAFTTYAGYRVFENEQAAVDLLGGARFFSLDLDLSLEPGLVPARSLDLSDTWADPVLGARARYDFTEAWFATVLGDYGGFGGGSNESWQLFASVGYQFNPRWSLQGGWRYLAVEKEIDGRDLEIDLSGPILGATFRF